MGLLDDLLAGLGGQGRGGQSMGQPQASPAGSNTSQIMMALLPVVLAMLSNRGGSPSQVAPGQRADSPGGGGLGDLLGTILGGSSDTSSMGGLGAIL